MPPPAPTKLKRFFVTPNGRAIPAEDYETAHALFQIYCGWLEYRVVESPSFKDTSFTPSTSSAEDTKKEQHHGSHQRHQRHQRNH